VQAGAHAKELQALADKLETAQPNEEVSFSSPLDVKYTHASLQAFFGLITTAISVLVPVVKSFL